MQLPMFAEHKTYAPNGGMKRLSLLPLPWLTMQLHRLCWHFTSPYCSTWHRWLASPDSLFVAQMAVYYPRNMQAQAMTLHGRESSF